MPALSDCRVQLIEQPLPADADDALARLESPIPICADESCRTLADLNRLDGKYQAITIKLDKAGGLTEALALALLVAQQAEMADLDGPLFLASDRFPGLRYEGSTIHPPEANFWGGPG